MSGRDQGNSIHQAQSDNKAKDRVKTAMQVTSHNHVDGGSHIEKQEAPLLRDNLVKSIHQRSLILSCHLVRVARPLREVSPVLGIR